MFKNSQRFLMKNNFLITYHVFKNWQIKDCDIFFAGTGTTVLITKVAKTFDNQPTK